METATQGREKSFCGPNAGLDSLAAAASCRVEDSAHEDDYDSKQTKSQQREEGSKNQKGKVSNCQKDPRPTRSMGAKLMSVIVPINVSRAATSTSFRGI